MSSRWFARSVFFDRSASFHESTTFDAEIISALRFLQFKSFLPVLCWAEKFQLLIDYFQLFSLIWIAAQPWPWPYLWTVTTRPLLYVNLDFFSLTKDGALAGRSSSIAFSKWGSMDNYGAYAFAFAISQFVVFSSILFMRKFYDAYGKKHSNYVDESISIAMLLSHILYLPCCLAVFRLYYCEPDSNVLSADPSVECWSIEHMGYFVICTLLMLPTFFGLPYLTYKYIYNNVIYNDSTDHEKRIQIWELTYMLKLDDFWIRQQIWLMSSFKKSAAYFRYHLLLLKAVLLIIFIFVRESFILQSLLMVGLLVIFSIIYTKDRYPYRAFTTNLMFVPVLCMLIVNTTFGMVNSFGVNSAVMVASTETLVLGSFNMMMLLIIVMAFLYTALIPEVLDWPTLQTMYRIQHNKALIPKVAKWIETIRESNHIKTDFLLAPVEIADVNALEECIRQLRNCWLQARSVGSIFETPIGDVLEELLYIHSSRIPYALRKFPYWNEAYQHAIAERTFQKREKKYSLMAPKKRKILMKLLAFRFIKGDRCKFDMGVAMEYMKSEKLMSQKQSMISSKSSKSTTRRRPSVLFNKFRDDASKLLLPILGSSKNQTPRNIEQQTPSFGDHSGGGSAFGFNEEDAFGGGNGADGGESSRFTPEDLREAANMIIRLRERTELALNKHHRARKQFTQLQQMQMDTQAQQQQQASASFVNASSLLRQINTMDLIKETVSLEEQNDLEELYYLWEEAIQLYEIEEFPGDYEELNREVENWYVYRGLVSERLEFVVHQMQRNQFENDLDNVIGPGQEVIEEGEDDEEEEDDIEKQSKKPLLSNKSK